MSSYSRLSTLSMDNGPCCSNPLLTTPTSRLSPWRLFLSTLKQATLLRACPILCSILNTTLSLHQGRKRCFYMIHVDNLCPTGDLQPLDPLLKTPSLRQHGQYESEDSSENNTESRDDYGHSELYQSNSEYTHNPRG